MQTSPCAFESCTSVSVHTRPFCTEHTRLVFGVEVKPSTISGAGDGLFATKDFVRGQFICPLDGEKITRQEMDVRRRAVVDVSGGCCYLMRGFSDDDIRDGMHVRFVGHNANASDRLRPANATLRPCSGNGTRTRKHPQSEPKKRARGDEDGDRYRCFHLHPLKLVATRRIAAGDEVILAYGRSYRRQWTTTKTPKAA